MARPVPQSLGLWGELSRLHEASRLLAIFSAGLQTWPDGIERSWLSSCKFLVDNESEFEPSTTGFAIGEIDLLLTSARPMRRNQSG